MEEHYMSKNILRYVSSQNLFGTMNTGTMNLKNLTDSDKKMSKNAKS